MVLFVGLFNVVINVGHFINYFIGNEVYVSSASICGVVGIVLEKIKKRNEERVVFLSIEVVWTVSGFNPDSAPRIGQNASLHAGRHEGRYESSSIRHDGNADRLRHYA